MTGSLGRLSHLIARYRWLRAHYRQCHLQVRLQRVELAAPDGPTLGYLDEIRLQGGRVHLTGWTLADRVVIRLGHAQVRRVPHAPRADVAQALGCHETVGFQAALPASDDPLQIDLDHAGMTVTLTHDLRMAPAVRHANRRLTRAFLRDVIPLVPRILRGLLRNDPDLPRQVKAALRLGPAQDGGVLDPRFLQGADMAPACPAPSDPTPVTILLPVHNAMDLLPEAISRIIAHTDLPWHLIVIEDGSTDPRIRPWLQGWVAQNRAAHSIELIENPENLGFVASVNLGLARAGRRGHPVILLNTDAFVPAGWASRLTAPLRDPMVASVTPMSNDAEIFGAPLICQPTALDAGDGDAIDARLRAQITPDAPAIAAPTGVGFCMALSAGWLERLGGFDAEFGRGYGEEVDWCRRAAAAGARHAAAPDLFVEHHGGASFGDEKQALVQAGNAIITRRYPGYDQMVQAFIRTDPLITPRLVAALAFAERRAGAEGLPVYIAHSMGGGAEDALQDRLRQDGYAALLRLGGAERARIEVVCPGGRLIARSDDLALALGLLQGVARRRVIYSCAVGDPDPVGLVQMLPDLVQGVPFEMLFHDYLPLSPSFTLRDQDGIYRGVPATGTTDPAHGGRRPDGTPVTLAQWRADWGALIAQAKRLVVFSRSSAEIVATAYPQARGKLALVPHQLRQTIPAVPRPAGGPPVIGVLGAIGPQKGAAVLAALAREGGVRLALVGQIAPGHDLGATPIHGVYTPEDIPHLVARYGITHWLIPSIWPETFSFTTHECLATGLPTMAFDLGAQGDAVRAAENGILLP
ncbi:MAG: glycosyltransferase, partial [Rhodobacteraceae bacterium]